MRISDWSSDVCSSDRGTGWGYRRSPQGSGGDFLSRNRRSGAEGGAGGSTLHRTRRIVAGLQFLCAADETGGGGGDRDGGWALCRRSSNGAGPSQAPRSAASARRAPCGGSNSPHRSASTAPEDGRLEGRQCVQREDAEVGG